MTTQPVRNNLALESSYDNCNASLLVQLHVRFKLDGPGTLLRRRTRSQRNRKSQTGRHPKIDAMHSDRPLSHSDQLVTTTHSHATSAIIAWSRNPVSCSKTRASRAI